LAVLVGNALMMACVDLHVRCLPSTGFVVVMMRGVVLLLHPDAVRARRDRRAQHCSRHRAPHGQQRGKQDHEPDA
jgi:hypothetical protein